MTELDATKMEIDTIRALLVEDSQSDARIVANALQSSHSGLRFELVHVVSLAESLVHFASHRVDVVLLDLSLPDAWGLDTFRELHAKYSEIPIIVLSGSVNDDLATQAVMSGAQDYIPKDDITGPMLAKTIRYVVTRFRLSLVERRQITLEKEHAEKIG